jgi:hypothetical protein
MLLGAALILCATEYAARFDWRFLETALSCLAIVAGSLSFMILLAFLMKFKGMRGMSAVSMTTIVGLLLLRLKIRRNGRAKNISMDALGKNL